MQRPNRNSCLLQAPQQTNFLFDNKWRGLERWYRGPEHMFFMQELQLQSPMLYGDSVPWPLTFFFASPVVAKLIQKMDEKRLEAYIGCWEIPRNIQKFMSPASVQKETGWCLQGDRGTFREVNNLTRMIENIHMERRHGWILLFGTLLRTFLLLILISFLDPTGRMNKIASQITTIIISQFTSFIDNWLSRVYKEG